MNFDPKPYAERIRRMNEAETARIRERAEKARAEARRLASAITTADPDVAKVFLFGSLAAGAPSSERFDIDLAIEGGDVYKALDLVDDSTFEVDVVQIDLLPDHFKARIESEGIVLATRS